MNGETTYGDVSSRPRRQSWIWIVVAIIVIAVAAGAWWFFRIREQEFVIAPGTTFTQAAAGRIVTSFPQEFILEKDVELTESYRIDYEQGGAMQPVAGYVSAKSPRDNIQAFRTYLVENGWELIQPGNLLDEPAFIFATKGEDHISITLQKLAEDQTRVSIAYLVKLPAQ